MSDVFLTLSPEDVGALRELLSDLDERADVRFAICPTCAHPTWKETRPDGTRQTTAVLGEALCGRCEGFMHRHPEVFAFVMQLGQARHFIAKRLASKEGA